MESMNNIHNIISLENRKEFLSYLRKNKLTIKDFLIKELNKKDLLTGEDLEYKNEEQYLNSDFNSRENLNNYLISIDRNKAKEFCINFYKKRKNRKGIIFAPSNIETKSFICPSINIIQKGLKLDYNETIIAAGLLPKFKYKGNFKYNDFGPIEIICDTREQKPLKFNNLKIQKLDIGDYCSLPPYYSSVFVERKSLVDLIGTLCPKNFDRFKREIQRVKELSSYLVVVVEESFSQLLRMKDLNYIKSQASPDYISHKIRELMEVSNILQFVFVNNRNESVRVIERIFKLGENAKQLDLDYLYSGGKL